MERQTYGLGSKLVAHILAHIDVNAVEQFRNGCRSAPDDHRGLTIAIPRQC
jgi:hypothetical protein